MTALAGVLLSASAYVTTDSTLRLGAGSAGALWLFAWWASLAFQMAYGKHLTQAVDMGESDRVFWTNVLGLPPTAVLCVLMGEHRLIASCVRRQRCAARAMHVELTSTRGTLCVASLPGWW